jgi:hypothetical protein
MSSTPEIYQDPWFRCISVVGFALLRYKQDIFDQTDEETGWSWSEIIEQLEKHCVAAYKQGFSDDPDYLIKRVKQDFTTMANRLRKEDAGLREVLLKLAKKLRPLSTKEISASFEELNKRGLILTGQCVAKWGGIYAKPRALQLKPFKLILDESDGSTSVTSVCSWTDASSRTIHLTVGGGEKPLVNFLCFEFYLFHEYFSHVLPTWEDLAGKLSEGYLFSIAWWWYLQESPPIDSALVAVDWQKHWARQKLISQSDYWRAFHRRSDWFEIRSSRAWFSHLLLEIAAFDNERDKQFQPEALAYIKSTWKNDETTAIKTLSAHSSMNVEAICSQLKAMALKQIDHKTLKRISL